MKNTQENMISNTRYLMGKHGLKNVTELAKRTGIPQPTLHRILAGDVKEPKLMNIRQISDYFGVTVADLLEKDLTNLPQHIESNVEGDPIPITFRKVPVVGTAELGSKGYWCDLEYPVGEGDGFIRWPTQDPDAYALRCTGTSMLPRIKSGEFVVIEPNSVYVSGDEVLVVTAEEESMIKTYLYKRDGYVNLVSVNEDHPPIRVAENDVMKIHYVAGIAKPALHSE
ncbi:S24 family peptidase [Sodalis endosymbiont of Spalangia cameroni]|uniref:S24 family peptidase n=1 Tax=Sodalis praecaptivus TaxID=1239307 RepID=UPI0031F9FD79